ncbi:MAG: NTP transferase domain-containing protein, partial [Chloroflexi bacterium]|nr:NTP transferase domain-containing protein [Chloroflexota bacterium]
MKSKRPKVLHEICGRPMLQHVVEAARAAGHEPVAIVVGMGADQVRATIGDGVTYVEQVEQ